MGFRRALPAQEGVAIDVAIAANQRALDDSACERVQLPRERRLKTLSLASLIFFTTCGGAFGLEPLIGATGAGWVLYAGLAVLELLTLVTLRLRRGIFECLEVGEGSRMSLSRRLQQRCCCRLRWCPIGERMGGI
jgi:hypothetical protein